MDEAVDAAEVDEGAEVDDRGDGALEAHATLELGEDLGALGLAGLDAGAHVGAEVLDPAEVNEGGRQEAAETDVEDKAALDDLDNLTLDVLAGVELLLDGVPGTLILGTLLGENQTTLLVLLLENESLDGLAEVDDLLGVDVLADGELAGGDDALRLEPDVKKNLIVLNLNDSARHKIALIKVGDGAVDEAVQLLVGYVIQREDGRVLNLTQRWTPFKNGAPIYMTAA